MALDNISNSVQAALEAARRAAEEAARRAAELAAKRAAEAAAKAAAEAAARAQAEAQAAAQRDALATRQGSGRLSEAAQGEMEAPPFAAEDAPQPVTEAEEKPIMMSIRAAEHRAEQDAEFLEEALGEVTGEVIDVAAEAIENELEPGNSVASDTVNTANEDLTKVEEMAEGGNTQAREALERREANLEAAREALPEEARQTYDRVRAAAEESCVEGAANAVDQILLKREPQVAAETFAALDRLANEPIHDSVAKVDPQHDVRSRLVGELAVQVAKPETIQQDASINSCAPAAIEARLAMENPAQYIDTVRKIASATDGWVADDGTRLGMRVSELQNYGDQNNRSLASGLLQQTALGWFGNGDGKSAMNVDRIEALSRQFFPNDTMHTFDTPEAAAWATEELHAGSTAVLQDAEGNHHAVTVQGKDDEGNVYYTDPLGEKHKSSPADFHAMLRGAMLPSGSMVPDSNNTSFDVGNGRFRPRTTTTSTELP